MENVTKNSATLQTNLVLTDFNLGESCTMY